MIEKRKAVFIDKDGTIIPDIPYNVNPDLISLYDGVIKGLQLLKTQGYIFVIISNQAGVAHGYFQENELEKVEKKLAHLLYVEGIKTEGFYFCPHHPNGKVAKYAVACDCRKPAPGMILKAAEELAIDVAQSWMIGDILNDVEAGNRAGCKTILINNNNETEWVKGQFRTPNYIAPGFLSAAKMISDLSSQTCLNGK